MAKKKAQITNTQDEKGFFHLTPTPGGRFDQFQQNFMGMKLPKNSDKFLYDLTDTYGTDKVIGMTEVDIGNYVYKKGINHALNMNVGRSIPWIEDGLKSGERRVLYIMWTMGCTNKSSKEKVASITGRMIEKVYPHGDQAAADMIYRLGRSRTMMIPYIVPGGDFGNMDVMRPASPRYAAASLSPYAMDCFFSDIGPKAPLYDVKDNYNFSSTEPVFLTSRYPNILMQWNQGIGKGASSWLGAFNSKDLFKVAIQMLDDPNCKVDIYPDLPIPAQIINKSKLKGCFDKTDFKVQIRAPYEVVTYQRMENGHKVDVHSLVFTALPLSVIGATVKKQIVDIRMEDEKTGVKRLPEVVAVHSVADDKSPGGIQFMVEYEKGYDPHVLAEKLYRMTLLSKTVGVRYILITDNQTLEFTPRKIMKQWIAQRFDQKRRLFHQKVLQAAKDRARLEAIATVLDANNIDLAISIIRKSKSKADSVEALRKQFGFTEFQAKMVLQVRLENLPKMSIEETLKERDKAIADYKYYRSLLIDEDKIKGIIKDELEDGLKKYGKPRMAPIFNLEESAVEDEKQQKWIFYNSETYYCLTNLDEMKAISDKLDKSFRMINIQNNDFVILVNNKSKIQVLNGFAFTANTQGISFNAMGAKNIVRILPYQTSEYTDVVTLTAEGYGKRMAYTEVNKSNVGSLVSISGTDQLVDAIPIKVDNYENMVIGIAKGSDLYYVKLEDFPKLKRASAGNHVVKGVKDLSDGKLFAMDLDHIDQIMIYGESGYVKAMDTMYLAFNKRKTASITLGKRIIGVVGLSPKTDLSMIDNRGETKLEVVVGKTVQFTTDRGESQKFKLTSSIGNPIKVFKKTKNDFYLLSNS